MKVLVDKIPTKPKECLFSKEVNMHIVTDNGLEHLIENYCRLIDGRCDFDKGHGCNKLKITK